MSLVASLVSVGAVSTYALLLPISDVQAIPALAAVHPEIGTSAPLVCGLPVAEEPKSPNAEPAVVPAPTESCLASAICAIKQRIRWRTPAWQPKLCEQMARAVLDSSLRYHLPPLLLVAIMINESTMNENAFRITLKDGALYAKDGGLMGIRCVLDKEGRCKNGNVRGMSWSDVIEPTANIAIAARQLAYWRDAGGVATRQFAVRDSDGIVRTKTRVVRCTHADHAFWVHYNHGERYIDHGPARNYPLRVGSLYATLSQTLKIDERPFSAVGLPSRSSVAWMRDPRVGLRQHSLCRTIMDIGPVCKETTTAEMRSQN